MSPRTSRRTNSGHWQRWTLGLALLAFSFAALVMVPWVMDGDGGERYEALRPGAVESDVSPGSKALARESRERQVPLVPAATSSARVPSLAPAGAAAVRANAELASREVRVVERKTGDAVVGAQVTLSTAEGEPGGEWVESVTTDEAGSARLPLVEGSLPRLRVRAVGYAELHRPVLGEGEPVLIELDPAAELRVHVQGPTATELEGGEAFLWKLGADQRAREELDAQPVDPEGFALFRDLAAGEYSLCVRVPGWSLGVYHAATALEGERAELSLRLSRGARVHGRVLLDETEAPVVGAELRLAPTPPGVESELREKGELLTITAAEGRYEFSGVSIGPANLWVHASWGSRRKHSLTILEAGEVVEHDFTLPAPASLAGSVVNSSGQGVGFASVHLLWDDELPVDGGESLEGAERGAVQLTCDINGRFSALDLPASRRIFALAFRADEDHPEPELAKLSSVPVWTQLRSAEERENFELRVFETRSVAGVVRSDRGVALEGVEVQLARREKKQNVRRGKLELQSTVTDEDGEFLFAGLVTGTYEVDCRHADYLQRFQSFRVYENVTNVNDLEVELEPCGSLAGWVVDQDGESVPFAGITAKAIKLDSVAGLARETRRERADEYGRFVIDQTRHGSWSIYARAFGYESSSPPLTIFTSSAEAIVLELERIEGGLRTLVRGSLMTLDDALPTGLRLAENHGGVLSMNGNDFRISGVRSGSASFRFEAPGYLPARTAMVTLPPGGEVDLGALELRPAGELTVFVRSATGKPLNDFQARLEPISGTKAAKAAQSLKLGKTKRRHKYKGAKGRITGTAAYSREVPVQDWRLVIEAKGHKTYKRVLRFDDKRIQSFEVGLGK